MGLSIIERKLLLHGDNRDSRLLETFPITDKNTRCHNPQEHINFLRRKYVKSHKDFHIPLGYFTFHLATFLFTTTTTIIIIIIIITIILHIDDNEENDKVNM